MSDESNAATERFERLARDHLGEYPQDDAVKVLTDIEDVEPGEVPDDVLVEAARDFLDAVASRTDGSRFPWQDFRNSVESANWRFNWAFRGWRSRR